MRNSIRLILCVALIAFMMGLAYAKIGTTEISEIVFTRWWPAKVFVFLMAPMMLGYSAGQEQGASSKKKGIQPVK